jgi:hypothetical protein
MAETAIQIIIPGYRTYGYGQEFDQLYKIIRQGQIKREEKFVIENVRFEHDPQWRTRFLSIQCAHDGDHPVWAAAHVIVRYAFPLASEMVPLMYFM